MMEWAKSYLAKVEENRSTRLNTPAPVLSEQEMDALVRDFHPDHHGNERQVQAGANAGKQLFPPELADLLESDSPVPSEYEPRAEVETDVLILGGGGAGIAAALTLQGSGLSVHLATKLRLGDSNTIMAEGGIQAALGPDDSSRRHFADTYVGGHGKNDTELLRLLCESGPESIRWLTHLGCLFDQNPDGTFRLRSGGGTSIPRVITCRDYTGLEILRVLRDALRLGATRLLENHAVVELLDDAKGQVTGAVLWNSQTGTLISVSARAVLLATGGTGQLRLQGFSTSNHLGATGDGLVLAYRQGCSLIHMDSYQYHPSGTSYPEALVGQLVTEAIRSIGAQILNAEGEKFIDEITYRDVVAAAIIRECREGRGMKTPSGRSAVWLDTPMIDLKNGAGTLRNQFPGVIHRFERYGIDPSQQPILVYPTLHYQNGGIKIDPHCRTEVKGLWAAGEVSGGLHGTNRLMGNSLLDVIVFGRRAAESIQAHLPLRKNITLTALKKYRQELKKLPHRPDSTSPLLFPNLSGLKIEISGNSIFGKEVETISEPSASKNYEPPDPFAGRFKSH